MADTPFFSVIIPAYNREPTIRETLESVAGQRFRNYEVIVIDDGSTDGTCEIVESYDFLTILRQQNAGPGSARNRGIEIAKGDYIAFLDSDDVWFPWTLQRYAEAITHHNSPAFVTGKPLCFRAEAELNAAKDAPLICRVFDDYYSTGEEWLWYGVSSFVIRRTVLESVGGFATGRINGEDAELAMRLGEAPGFVHIANPPAFGYRHHAGNITLDHTKSYSGIQLLIDSESNGRFPGGNARAIVRATIISRHIRPLAVSLASSGHVAKAWQLYREVFREALRRRRLKFLIGLPALILGALAGTSLSRKRCPPL